MPALLMEFVDGPSLERVIPRVRLTLDQVDALFRDILEGMAAAHAAGFVHRDLKPGNVMVSLADDAVVAKVADFGLVKAEDASGTVAATQTGAMMGTPAYMAPEQVRDAKDVDARADVFALGAIAYELLTQQRAFQGEDTFDIFEAIVRGTYPPLDERVTGVPERMRTAVTRALQVEREGRFASAGEMLAHWSGDAALPGDVWRPEEADNLRAMMPDPAELGPVPTWSSMQPLSDDALDAPVARTLDAASLAPPPSPWLKRVAGVSLLAVLGVGGWTWDQSRIKVSMHPDLVWRYGVPDGVGEWSEGMLRGYRVTRRGGRVLKVEHVTPQGTPVSLEEDTMTPRWNGGLPGAAVIDMVQPCGQDDGFYLFRAFCGGWAPDESRPRATTLVPRYDDAGRVTEVAFLDAAGSLRAKRQIRHDSDSLRIAWQTASGMPQASGFSPAYERHRLDENGYVRERTAEMADGGQASFMRLGAWSMRYRRDSEGRELERELLDLEGQPVVGLGASRIVTTRDATGLPTRQDGYGADERAPFEGCHSRLFEHDERGRRTHETCLDGRGEVTLDGGGCAMRTYRYGEASFETRCLGPDARPIPSEANWSAMTLAFGPGGRPVEARFTDPTGAPTPAQFHTQSTWDAQYSEAEWVGTRIVAERDALGLLSRVSFFQGDEPHPIALGLSSWAVERDERGLITRWQVYGPDGQPIDSRDGVCRLDLVRDADLNVTELRWFDASGAPTMGVYGHHLGRVSYNLGLPVEWSYFGVDDEPVTGSQGWHRKAVEQRDDQGHALAHSFWGVSGEPVEPDGYHLERLSFGASGWVDSWAYFDSQRQPVIGPYGCAALKQTGQPMTGNSTTECFGPDGKRMVTPLYRAALVESRRDGLVRERIRYGVDGEVLGRRVRHYDGQEVLLAEDDIDVVSGQSIRTRWQYDERGHEVRRWYVGDDDELVLGPEGWAELRHTVDARGNPLADAWFDAGGQPMNRPGTAYHEQRSTFDALDRPLSLETFDAEGQPALDAGSFGQRYTYDLAGNVVRIVNLLPEGSDQPARIDRTYDAFGRQTGSRVFDTQDAPLETTERGMPAMAGWDVAYDAFGRPVKASWIGADSGPKACPAGFSEAELDWDDRDRELTVRFRHEGGLVALSEGETFPWWGSKPDSDNAVGPMHQATGILAPELRGMAGLRFALDAQRRVTRATFLGADGHPAKVDGVWGYRQTWDANGRVTEVQWTDDSGAPAVHRKLGWAVREDQFDASGELTGSATYDADRKLLASAAP
ncbi:MAG: serine/threonine protein kinase [Deltaproteobacteria bacterium]|nr:MAG: serine/threonine protein kinase [Deltaproteobacteria bacterium]